MFRRSALFAAIALVALAGALGGKASAVSPEDGPIVRVELELQASDGLRAELETSQKEVVTLMLQREGQVATYEVQGEVTEAGLKVGFGRLGRIDVGFTPTTVLDATPPPPGCTGAPRTLREGVFTGTIDFRGERGYVRLEAPSATGSMSVISPWDCPESEEMAPFAQPFRLLARRSPQGNGERETASLEAGSRDCACFFAAGVHHRHSGGGSIFSAVAYERREGMEIVRGAVTHGSAGAFSYSHAKGTATLRPPAPFTGTATFERRPGPDLWRSTIRAPLLGADPLRTAGFRAALYPEYHFD